MPKNKNKCYDCFECDECIYIGDGDSVCMDDTEEPKIVIENFGEPSDDFLWCRKEK